MGDKSGIEWTDATWNPVVGCSKVSPGCAHCYAEELHRTRLSGTGAYPVFEPWTPANAAHNVTLAPERLDQPLRWTKPRMVFVNSMSDMFHELVPAWYVAQVWAVMALAKQHTFQILTKRPERMRLTLSWGEFPDMVLSQAKMMAAAFQLPTRYANEVNGLGWVPRLPLPNVWLGTSIENRRFVGRADDLRATPAAVRFISAEPLLGPLLPDDTVGRKGDWLHPVRRVWRDDYTGPGLDLTDIDQLIVGGESGARHRPMDIRWVQDLRDACLKERGMGLRTATQLELPPVGGTAFFFKQWGGRTPKSGGRLLDGRMWDETPLSVT